MLSLSASYEVSRSQLLCCRLPHECDPEALATYCPATLPARVSFDFRRNYWRLWHQVSGDWLSISEMNETSSTNARFSARRNVMISCLGRRDRWCWRRIFAIAVG
jgi:hypothetical protein